MKVIFKIFGKILLTLLALCGAILLFFVDFLPKLFGKKPWSEKPLSQEEVDKLKEFTNKMSEGVEKRRVEEIKKEGIKKLITY